MSFVHSPKIVTDGLVLALDAGNTKSYPGSGTTWFDKSGNARNGTLTNGPTFNSANGGSIVFDSVDDYINLSSPLELSSAFTITCFFNQNTSAIARSFLGKTSGGSGTKLIFLSNNNIFFRMVDGGSSVNFSIGYSSSLYGQWNYLVAIRSSSNVIKASLNGTSLVTNTTLSGTFSPTSIGRNGDGQYWDGKIANMSIYNRELSAEEVQQNFNALRGRFGI